MSGTPFTRHLLERATAAGVAIPIESLRRLDAYFQLLVRWNRKINLTSLPLDPDNQEMLDRMFLEPLAAAGQFPPVPLAWVDVGSGGGSPAIPLKIVRPRAELTMVESRSRKTAFLREVVRELGLADSSVIDERLEAYAENRGKGLAEMVTVRAVRPNAALIKACRRALRTDGKLLVFARGVTGPLMDWPGFQYSGSFELIGESGSNLWVFVAS